MLDNENKKNTGNTTENDINNSATDAEKQTDFLEPVVNDNNENNNLTQENDINNSATDVEKQTDFLEPVVNDNNENNTDASSFNDEQQDKIEQSLEKYKDIFNQEENKNQLYQWDYEKYSKMDQFAKERTSKNKGVIVFASILCSIIAICLITFLSISFSSWLGNIAFNNKEDLTPQEENYETVEITYPDSKEGLIYTSNDATKIAKKIIPSVVSVVPYIRMSSIYPIGIVEAGSASGIIMSKDGYIITNSHVVINTPSMELVNAVKVILNDKREYEAKIVGVDINTDLCVLKINADNLTAAEFGDSNLSEVGETVYAIGSPLDLEYSGSMTAGIISALNRTVDSTSTIGCDNKYIQTDAAINPGNSGGALVNEKGQVIGINSSKISATQIEGMGFSIPITPSKSILDDLIKYGHVKGRVKLGIAISKEIGDMLAKYSNVQTGLLIESATNPDLINKGIVKYDILHEIDGIKIKAIQELKEQLKKHNPGDTVHVVFYRYDQFNNNESKIEVDVKLIEDEGILNK